MTEMLAATTLETALGSMHALASSRGLCALEFTKPERQQLLARRLARWFPQHRIEVGDGADFEPVRAWLQDYFSGRFERLSEPRLDLRGTPFELQVWQEMRQLSVGRTISYAELAAQIGSPQGFRAVGNASRKNPVSLIVPCHRVVGTRGDLTGYGGGLHAKEWLIRHERTGCPLQAKA